MKGLHEPVHGDPVTATLPRRSIRTRAIAVGLGALAYVGASIALSNGQSPREVVAYAVAIAGLIGVVALLTAVRRSSFSGPFPLVTVLAGTWATLAALLSAWTSDQELAVGLMPMAVGLAVLTLARAGLELVDQPTRH